MLLRLLRLLEDLLEDENLVVLTAASVLLFIILDLNLQASLSCTTVYFNISIVHVVIDGYASIYMYNKEVFLKTA